LGGLLPPVSRAGGSSSPDWHSLPEARNEKKRYLFLQEMDGSLKALEE